MVSKLKISISHLFLLVIILALLQTLVSCDISENKRNKYYVRANESLDKGDYEQAIKLSLIHI